METTRTVPMRSRTSARRKAATRRVLKLKPLPSEWPWINS